MLAKAATGFVDSDAWRAQVGLQLLVDAGADVSRARVLRAQVQPRRVVDSPPHERPGPHRPPEPARATIGAQLRRLSVRVVVAAVAVVGILPC